MKTESFLFTHEVLKATTWKVSVFGVFLAHIQSQFEKIQTRKTLNMDTFHAVRNVLFGFDFIKYISNIY